MVYLAVGLAGIAGSLLRYYIGVLFLVSGQGVFPWATLVINLLGCFLLGFITTYIAKIGKLHPHLVTAIGTGFVGSFTTFSTFSVETATLLKEAHTVLALLYVFISALGGLLFSLLGYKSGEFIQRKGAEM
ncbi:fluoride efflux transporter CrcB [Virgibacillus halophilus]|uniref:Fluoride-specific ion channel FluC n=1 Tax=Tigheibacillus halophilus TaxID=361280 RepID=A0ABU5C4G4_9BACI|nr:fluoride efflux transporter CrcB [Virgibacillus halophilus]